MTLEHVEKAIHEKLASDTSACIPEVEEFVFAKGPKMLEDLSETLQSCELNELSILTVLRFVMQP